MTTITQVGTVLYRLEDAAEALKMHRDFVANGPAELTLSNALLTLPATPNFPAELHGEKVLMVTWVYAGPVDEAELATRPLRWYGRPAADLTANLPSALVQGRTGAVAAAPDFLELTDDAIDTIVAEYGAARAA